MKNKKLTVLIVLIVLAVASLIYGLSSPTKGWRSVRGEAKFGGVSASASIDRSITDVKRLAKRTKYNQWARDPFVSKSSEIEYEEKLVLNGIMWDSKNPKAIINNGIVGVGDKIEGNTVIDIKEDRVILNDGTNELTLTLR